MNYKKIYSNFIESIFEEHNKDIGKANTNNTNNSIDGNNNFSGGNIEVGNGSAMGNNNLVKKLYRADDEW